MGLLFTPKLHVRQPGYLAQPNLSGAGRGLKFLYNGLTAYGVTLGPMPTGVLITKPTAAGIGVRADGSGSLGWATADGWANHANAGGFTAFVAFYKVGTAANYSRPFNRTCNNGASAPYANWDFEINPAGTGQDKCLVNYCTGGTAYASLTTDNIITGYNTIAMSWDGFEMVSYSQGVLRNLSNNAPATNATQAGVYIGGDGGSSSDTGSVVLLCATWYRALKTQEQKSLHLNPWQLLAPVKQSRYFDIAAAPIDPEIRKQYFVRQAVKRASRW